MMKRLAILALVVGFLGACGGRTDPASSRAARAEQAKGDIVIGVGAPFTGDLAQFGTSMINGVMMAVEEINSAGGVLGRKITIEKGDDQAKANEGTLVAQRFAGNPDMVAVLGHFNSSISHPASAIYQSYGLLMLTPASTNPIITQQGFNLVFRNLPNDDENGRQLADFAVRQGYKRLAIYFANNTYGKGLADVFEARAKEQGIAIIDRQSYDPGRDEDFRAVLTNWKGANLDAICIAGETPKAANIISQARELGINVPVMGGDGLASSELWELGGPAAEGTFVVQYFHPSDTRAEVVAFNEKYQKAHGRLPDVWAAQAYDAMKVLAAAMEKAGSTVPAKVADALRTIEWQGVTGHHAFDQKGDVIGKKVVITVVRNRAWALHTTP